VAEGAAIIEALRLLGETPCECEDCLSGDDRDTVYAHALHQLALAVNRG
tara:strand:- start:49 stop:195 length:147 start_codon:yes stop_codon:yes gene_type:complete